MSRTYENPVLVRVRTKDRPDEILRFEVSEYQVTKDHLVLTREEPKSKVTKYVTLDSLRSFEFDTPLNYRPSNQPVVLMSNSPVIVPPTAPSGPVMTVMGQEVDLVTQKRIRKVDASTPLPPQSGPTSENQIVKDAFVTGSAAGFVS